MDKHLDMLEKRFRFRRPSYMNSKSLSKSLLEMSSETEALTKINTVLSKKVNKRVGSIDLSTCCLNLKPLKTKKPVVSYFPQKILLEKKETYVEAVHSTALLQRLTQMNDTFDKINHFVFNEKLRLVKSKSRLKNNKKVPEKAKKALIEKINYVVSHRNLYLKDAQSNKLKSKIDKLIFNY